MLYALQPMYNRQRSFYGKAIVMVEEGGITLVSYNTQVCTILENGDFIRLWDGWSATTARHVNEFRMQNGLHKISKSEWYNIPLAR